MNRGIWWIIESAVCVVAGVFAIEIWHHLTTGAKFGWVDPIIIECVWFITVSVPICWINGRSILKRLKQQ